MTEPTEHYADLDGADVVPDVPVESGLPTPCPIHGLAVLDQAGRCMPSCGHGWTPQEMAGVYEATLPEPPEPAPDPHPQDHFADWLARWFDAHTAVFGRCANKLSHECAGMLAGDMHAAGFAVVRVDDLQVGIRVGEWADPPDAAYEAFEDEMVTENRKMAEQQEFERSRKQ